MFTVLIAEKEHINAIRKENKLFFEPFLENKELAFCEWNPAGQSLSEAVPGLYDAVGRCSQWRAIILNEGTPELRKTQNPFDAVDFTALKELPEPPSRLNKDDDVNAWEKQWEEYFAQRTQIKEVIYKSAMELPLQKLSTWLCFRPEDYILKEVEEKQSTHEWAIEQLGRLDEKPSVRLELLNRDQYRCEQRMKELIRREFVDGVYLNIAYPVEVQCVSTRTAENNFFDPDSYWSVRRENEYSTFADRNMYFDKMRFMVFDLLPTIHRDFRNDYIRFLAFLLIFASNPVPGSTMQARRMYRIEMKTDETPLRTLVTSYDRKLAASYDCIEAEIEQIRSEIPGELTDKAAEELFCTPTHVPVVLDSACKPDKVYAEKDYGLFFDSPENEFQKWDRSYEKTETALAFIVKQQSRAVRKSVNQMHYSSEVVDVNINRLTPLQIDDIRDYTDTAEDKMVESIPPDLEDMSGYTKKLEKASKEVKKVIRQRMSQKTTLILAGVCLSLFFICFCPFLFDNSGSVQITSTAIGLTLGMLAALAAIMIVTLFFLRSSVTTAVSNYNDKVSEIMNEIQDGLAKFSRYLSAVCNVRRGHFVQNHAKNNVDVYTTGIRIRMKHQEDIRKKRAYLEEEYGDYFGDRADCDEVMSRPYEYDFGQKTEYTYPAPFLAGDCRQIEFMSSGNFVTVPSSYVTKVTVRMEELYEK
ncbi:MAG: hypothetical protein E7455_04765 [Ruminococcaceae bacterium]|nr:hypothetical protein [Oscillospiraceae bacterium]